ncbi:MAG: ComEC/Rec2 family competence protein, partial [Bacteroidetes bacterium]|nr:ComEC/Rec2 family competence protein [Bacteroidota bacterium]
PTSKEFAKGIILADRTEMGQEMTEDFSKTGLVHFLAISGTHMIVIFWLISFVLMKLFPRNLKKLAIVLSLIFIWVFTVFIDYGSSVVRSALMLTVYYSFSMLNRKPDVLHSLSLAGFILLVANTQSLFDVGFQLSFLAVLGIYWLNPSFEKLFPKPRNNFQKFFISITSVSISAQLATLPLVIYYFHQYSVLSIFVNILIVPFSEIIIIFSLLMTLLLGIGLEIKWIDWLFDRVVTILMEVIHFFSKIDWAYFENIPLSLVEVVLLFVLMYHIPNIVLKKNNKQIVIFSFFLMMTFAVRLFLNFYYNNKNEVLTMKNGKKEMLILKKKNKVFFYIPDGSDTISIKKYTVNPYLSSRRTNNYRLRFIPNNSSKVLIDGKLYNLK